MPIRSKRFTKKKTTAKKRTYRKRYNRKMRIAPTLVPPKKILRLKYADRIQIDAGAGTTGTHVFNLSSIYDPDVTASGHQPLYHDQLSALYNHYMVLGAKIRLTPLIASNDNYYSGLYGVHIKDNTSTISDPTALIEQNRTRYAAVNGQAGFTKAMTVKYSPRKLFAYKDLLDQRARFGAQFGANPAENAYAHVWVSGSVPANNPNAFEFLITITYIVCVDEPISISQS